MNKVFFALAFILTLNSLSFAQEMSKDEKKEWSSKLKSMSPETFKALVENKDKYKEDVINLQTRVDELESENNQINSEISDYKAAAAATEEKAQQAASAPVANASNSGTATPEKGVVFKVQVGAFKSFDLTKYFDRHQNFSGEVDADGTMKYTLGIFSDYWEADKFKKYMREMGVKGAWIVSYKDGKRVNIKEVLEGSI